MTVTYDNKPKSRVTFAGIPVRKRDTEMVVQDNLLYEDQFSGLYWSDKNPTNLVIEPPFNPKVLIGLVTKNNILAQCISAMEVNIDGTGWSIEPVDDTSDAKPDAEYKQLEAFFTEPFPDIGYVTLRRRIRYDLECAGNGYLEVLRNMNDDIVFLRWIDVTTIRLVKLDEPVEVEKEIVRGGQTVKAKMLTRERRYAQKIGEKTIFFKEFGASREVHREKGIWEEGKLSAEERGTEIIHLTLDPDPGSPYGIPRWINQLPSVLGSRKAEEFNLEFFDSGGVPPAAVFIQGGALAADVMEQLRGYFNGGASAKHRVALVEVQSASGSLQSPGSVQVKTERFGESKADSMFQKYDQNTEEHVRVGFRLPPMFVGRAQDYNFATAMTGYMVTEAQVFAPERLEFDEIINNKIVRSLGVENWLIKSKPLTIKNVEVQLAAMELVADKVDPEEMIGTVNDIAGLDLKFSKEAYDKAQEAAAPQPPAGTQPQPQPQPKAVPAKRKPAGSGKVTPIRDDKGKAKNTGKPAVKKAEDMSAQEVVELVTHWSVAMELEEGDMGDVTHILKQARELNEEQRAIFNNVLATKSFANMGLDLEGMAELAGCCADIME